MNQLKTRPTEPCTYCSAAVKFLYRFRYEKVAKISCQGKNVFSAFRRAACTHATGSPRTSTRAHRDKKKRGKMSNGHNVARARKRWPEKKKRKRNTHGHPITCCDCRRKQKTEKEQAEHGERHRARKNFHGRRVRQHLFPCTLAPGIEIVPRETPKVFFFNLRSPLRSEIPFSSSPPNDRSIYLLLLHSWSTDISDNHF